MQYFLNKGKKELCLELWAHVCRLRIQDEKGKWHEMREAKNKPGRQKIKLKLEKLLEKYRRLGYKVAFVREDEDAEPKTPKKLTPSQKFKEEADEVVQMWRDDEYDNYKDALLDVRSLLAEIPKELPDYQNKLTRLRQQILKQARKDAQEDPVIKEYLKGLI